MSYDFFLWRTRRVVESHEIDESSVETRTDVAHVQERLSTLLPGLEWGPDDRTANDRNGHSTLKSVRLPTDGKPGDPLVVRTSHRAVAENELQRIGQFLECLVLDCQSGRILWQPGDDSQ